MTSYEEYRIGQVIDGLENSQHFAAVTHLHVIHTLEALHLPAVASWYWQDRALTEADLDLEIRP